jgi:beta-lactamase superfamily II metal-dependent hydrolase
MKFNVTFLPARYGDSIWVEYGDDDQTHRILIDGGTQGTRTNIRELIEALPEEERHFELVVVTHIDRDHIEGILALLEEQDLCFTIDEIWFNSWRHLPENEEEEFGAIQGERLTGAILKHKLSWNETFEGSAVVISDEFSLPVNVLPGGMELTLLSPYTEQLVDLRKKWEKEVVEKNKIPGFGEQLAEVDEDEEEFGVLPDVNALNDSPFKEDDAAANGSSIAFLASYGGSQVLFAGDAFPSIVLKSLNTLFDGKAPIDLVKLSHHGSKGNTSPELIEKIDSKNYIISTNGSNYHHPDEETISRVIKRGGSNVSLYFNYLSNDNKVWNSPTLKAKHKYKAIYPDTGEEGISISVL